MVEDIAPIFGIGSDPEWLTNINGTLYFSASGGLWKCVEREEDFPWEIFIPLLKRTQNIRGLESEVK
jgi:hypothetical protein